MRAADLNTDTVYAYRPWPSARPRPARLLSLGMWTTRVEALEVGQRLERRFVPSRNDTRPLRSATYSANGDVGYLAVTGDLSGLEGEHLATVLQSLQLPSGLDPEDVAKLRLTLPEHLDLEILLNRCLVGRFVEVCEQLRVEEEKARERREVQKAAEENWLRRVGQVRDRIAAHGLERHKVQPGRTGTHEVTVPIDLLESLLTRLEPAAF
ncbi:hypothetical protein AB0D90_14585 [Streptomyces althioticus]|uniref:hypothetical protein n=1 Tax=Streptomyces althioticus TaxID=83380 RepID=UPI0033C1619F